MMTPHQDSKQWRILNAEPKGYSQEARRLLRKWGRLEEKEMSRAELLRELDEVDVLIIRLAHQVDREVIEAGNRLKVIVTATTGLDHIDIEFAESRGITVLSLRGETEFLKGVSATAEHTWALLLGLIRRIVPSSMAAARGQWDRDTFRGHELDGKYLGIVGLGRIGVKVARYGEAFGMTVGAYDPFVRQWLSGVRQTPSLTALLERSDILSLHVPLTEENRGMIGAPELAQLPAGALLINTSRGQLIDEVALTNALEQGHLAGAALDVIAQERDVAKMKTNPCLAYAARHDNLLITPHIGGATYESMAKTEVFMAHKLTNFYKTYNKP